MNKVNIISLGCAKNLTDAEIMLGKLQAAGYEIVENQNHAEIIIVNTCCFIDSAKQESIETILDIADLKKDAKLKLLIVAGCMGERFKQEVLDELPEVDAVCGTGDFADICDVIEQAEKKRGLYLKGCENAPLEVDCRTLLTPPYTAYLKIAEGCDNHCTYCVIPSIRGKYRSRKMENILDEAELLVQNGAKELVIIAQDVSCYGKDIYGKYALPELITKLTTIEGLEWLRLHYLYPEEIDDTLLDAIASNPKIVRYFDIPIQHISDDVLKRMGRKTTGAEIIGLIQKIRSKMPDAVIRTSLIVGFPGETEESFNELLKFVRTYKIEHLGAFTFSCEEGTPAAKLPDQIDEDVKIFRQEKVMELQYEIVEAHNNSRIGRTEKVLVEGYDRVIKLYFGRTYRDSIDVDAKVFVHSEKTLDIGGFYDVKLTDVLDYDMLGELSE
ncbi:MAG: 30S ribosomal protein S12 methylthiotransferase RimO [Clostridia bacterium]|nr:30S ribosomal protein S12 methylthiotransferase RimO [Clostridia bacterium]